jgi:hypothetical protein
MGGGTDTSSGWARDWRTGAGAYQIQTRRPQCSDRIAEIDSLVSSILDACGYSITRKPHPVNLRQASHKYRGSGVVRAAFERLASAGFST